MVWVVWVVWFCAGAVARADASYGGVECVPGQMRSLQFMVEDGLSIISEVSSCVMLRRRSRVTHPHMTVLQRAQMMDIAQSLAKKQAAVRAA